MGVIPSGYKQLDWLETVGYTEAGLTYIDTGIKPDADTEAEGVFSIPNNVYGNFFGARTTGTGAANWFVSVANINPSKSAVWYNNTYTQITLTGITGNNYYWQMKVNKSRYTLTNLQTQAVQSVNYNATSFPNYSIYVFARNQNGNAIGANAIRCKWFRISKSGVPVIDLIPALRLSDGKPGMWDTVSETFFTNAGSFEFMYSCEADTSPLFYLRQGLAAQPHLVSVPSAAIASFSTDFPAKLDKLQVGIDLVQTGSGNPSPDNVRPITGWTGLTAYRGGLNLLDRTNATKGKRLDNVGGLTGKTGAETSDYISVVPGQRYAARGIIQNGIGYGVWSYDKNKTKISYFPGGSGSGYGGSAYFNAPSNACYVRVTYAEDSASAMLMAWPAGSSSGVWDVPFESAPPISAVPVNWTSEAGTVYGGNLNVTTGVLTVTWESITLNGTEVKYEYGSYTRWSITPFSDYRMYYERSSSAHIKSDRFISISAGGSGGSQVGCYINGGRVIGLQHVPGTPTTVDEIKAWLAANPTQVVFKLATPKTYQLTPTQVKTLLGANNIWADTGNTALDYWNHG